VSGGAEYNGWALNISRGGLRVVIEERVELGQEFEIRELDPDVVEGGPFNGRVVWVQDEPDGSVVGLEFVGPELPKFLERSPLSAQPPPPPSVASAAPISISSPPPSSKQVKHAAASSALPRVPRPSAPAAAVPTPEPDAAPAPSPLTASPSIETASSNSSPAQPLSTESVSSDSKPSDKS
jgi:hypothetical protein